MNQGIESVTTVIFNGDRVLLVKNGDSSDHPTGIYGLPAGRKEPGESWEEAAIRECVEESGLKPLELIKLPTFYIADLERKDGKKVKFCCWSFYSPRYEGSLKATSETEPVWIDISEVNKLNLVKNVEKMIQEALMFVKK